MNENPSTYYKNKIKYDRTLFIGKILDEYANQLGIKEHKYIIMPVLESLVGAEKWSDYEVIEKYEEIYND